VLRGGCERVLLTRCPPRDSNVVGLCRLKQVDPYPITYSLSNT
jgi:hypothetical protein